MDYRHFELQDLLAEALSALDGRRYDDAAAAVRRALAVLEADWLSTPTDARAVAPRPAPADDDGEDD